jgi:hypothetical protein
MPRAIPLANYIPEKMRQGSFSSWILPETIPD